MIRKTTNGDISDEEFNAILKPFLDNYDVLSVNKQITQLNNRTKFEFSDTKTRDSIVLFLS